MDENVENKNMETEFPSSSDEEDNELELRAEELERQITVNHYLYDIHVELVELYRKLGDLNSMRSAYERFHNYFPLTPVLWLTWIKDEIKLAHSSSENKNILALFDKAVDDYQSVKLWQEYAQFAIGSCSVEDTRNILERGLNSVGLHVAEGSLLWDTLREFELAHLSLAEPDSDSFQSQLSKVVEVFRRQLSVPLLGMESTYNEWQEFLKQLPDDHKIDIQPVDWGYKNALKALNLYKPFEDRLLTPENDAGLYATYKEYIATIKDPSLILCIYERAVAKLCLDPVLWEDYCYYTLKLGELVLKVSSRSLRNCPWNASLWITRLRILEYLQRSEKEILECFEDAVKSVSLTQMLDLWLTYIEYIKRTTDDVERINKIFDQAKHQLGVDNDPGFKLWRLQARFAANKNDISSSRKLWSEILRNPQNKLNGNFWMEYLGLEHRFGDLKQMRSLFQKAISNCKDWEQYFADEWLMFEREVGTLQDVLNCVEKCKNYIKSTVDDQYPIEQKQGKNLTSPSNIKKRYYDEVEEKTYKRRKVYDNISLRDGVQRRKKLEGDSKMEVETGKNVQGPLTDIEPSKTVFVSNLNSQVDEDKLKDLFANSVKITIPRRKGVSRRFAYIQFANDNEAQDALKRDREPLDGRPLFVSECKPDRTQRQSVFKYSDTMEFNKLFVKGLPKYYTKENIEAIFKPYGATDIRLVNKFNGQFKGLAYIDFANDEDAEKALQNTNEMAVGEYTITVAISAPPSKKTETVAPPKLPVRNSKSKLEIAFVPRSVQVKKNVEDQVQHVSKTNDDFRKLLLNK